MSGAIRNDWKGFWWRPFDRRGIAVEIDRPWLYGEMTGKIKVWRIGRLAIALLPAGPMGWKSVTTKDGKCR